MEPPLLGSGDRDAEPPLLESWYWNSKQSELAFALSSGVG